MLYYPMRKTGEYEDMGYRNIAYALGGGPKGKQAQWRITFSRKLMDRLGLKTTDHTLPVRLYVAEKSILLEIQE